MKAAAALAAAVLLAACSSSNQQGISDWERSHPEAVATAEPAAAPTPPPMPRKENLIEFYVSPTATFHYFIDGTSLQVFYKQREIRYVLVARSPSGVENVSFEAIRCPDAHRIYALGTDDGKWGGRSTDWQEIQKNTARGWPYVLARQFFCPHRDPIQSVAEGVNALRSGSHPQVYVEPRPVGGAF
jgi:hypothetical protein